MNNLQPSFRFAQRKDTGLILAFIKSLAEYEKMAGNVIATEELLEEWIFDKGKAEVLFVVENGIPVGFALFFHNFSTFLGRAGIYLEDLFILPEHRGKGYGKAILKNWRPQPWNGAAAVWNGAAWTGTGQALISTFPWVRSRWKIGQPTGSAEIPSKKWQKLIVNGKRPSIDSAHPACYPRNIFST